MVVNECFVDVLEFDINFELSKRKSLNLRAIKDQVIEHDLVPFIIDISINGYSSKDDFDFEINGQKWSDVKGLFIKGTDAQHDPEALTVKRAIRVCAQATTAYIEQNNVVSHLKAYAPDDLSSKYAHLGGAFVVSSDEKDSLIEMWTNFDREKRTTVLDSVDRILNYRFP